MPVIVKFPGTSTERESSPPIMAVKRPSKSMPGSTIQIVLTHSKAKSLAQSITQGVVPLPISNIVQSLGTVPSLLLPTLPVELPTLSFNYIPRGLLLFIETPTEVNSPPIIKSSIPRRRARPAAHWTKFMRKYLGVRMSAPKQKPKCRARQKARGPSSPSSFESSFLLLSTSPWVLHIPSPWEAFYFHLLYNPFPYTGHRSPFCIPYSPLCAPRGTTPLRAPRGTPPSRGPRGTSPSRAPHGTTPSCAPRGTSPSRAPRCTPSFLAPRSPLFPFSPPAPPDSLLLSRHRVLLLQTPLAPPESPKSFLHSLLAVVNRVLRPFSHCFRGFSPHMSF
ncbi:hypothetical protein Taro_047376 [Colocasia esculenta]|uniref:Uncharacterized protein n=1 Tax=Colocasia esculenta TaxID=4460 RepID=A0A843X6L8_COLES|nr:hypothetical protein [Colocasia esculenta]